MLRRLLLALLLSPLLAPLAGCGFHLRSEQAVSYKAMAVQGKAGAFMDLLKRQLAAQGVTLVAPNQAEAVLTILDDSTSQTAMAYNADGTVAEYQLNLDLRYQLAAPNGDLLIAPTALHQVSYLSYATSVSLAKADEADLLYRGMRQDLLTRILFQLSARHAPVAAP